MRPRTLASIVIVCVVIGAGMAGAAADRILLRAHDRAATLPDTGFHPLSAFLRSPTEEERRRVRSQLARDLSLSADQAKVVDSILDAHAIEFRALREEIRPRVETLTNAVRRDVERALTPEQRDHYRALLGPAAPGSDSIRASR